MKKYILDLSVINYFAQGNAPVHKIMKSMSPAYLGICPMTHMEVIYTLKNCPKETAEIQGVFYDWLASLEILPMNKETSFVAADLAATLRDQGIALSIHDIWIAALALQDKRTLVSANPERFHAIKGLKLEDWRT